MGLGFTDFKEIMLDEYNDLIYKFKLPPGIAPNISLKENIFALFTCIRTKIPLFILGQPGSSKTLSVNQIISSMRNKISENNYFKTLQEVYPYFYQGHLQSTSDKIEKTFKIAKNFQKKLEKNQNNNNNLKQDEQKNIDAQVMIIIDEIGLAEISPYNPLKVLHPLLEPQSEQDQIAFVGISNWSLDASKMNRGISLQKPKLDLTQLEETAVAIYQDLLGEDKGLSNDEKIKDIFKNVSQLYLDYIQKNNQSNFHGLRDFYFLIKYISKCFKEQIHLNQFDEKSVIYKAILKNFGGDQKMLKEFIDLYQNRYQTQIQDQQMITKKLIKENLQDNGINDRNLMLISRNIDLALHNLSSIINDNKQNIQEEQEIEEEEKLNSEEKLLIGQEQGENQEIKKQKKQEQKDQLKYKKVNYFVGSNFSEDKKVDRSYEIINQVIGCVQNGEICILINLDDIYQSFYDLLNQNFSTYSQGGNLKYFCRVSIGAESSKIQVNEHFKLVLIQDAQTLSRLDPPLLNRFEKHFIDDQINDQEFNQFSDWVQQINVGQKLFTFQDQTVLKSLYQQFKNQNYPQEQIVEACQNEILKLVNLNGLKFLLKEKVALNLNESYVKMLEARLNQKNYNTLDEYLQYHPNIGRKIYSYVYTSNYKQYKHDFEEKLKQFQCKIIDIDNIQQESNLIRQVENYFENAQKNLLLILYDLQNPNNNKDRFTKIKFIIDDYLLKYKQLDHKNIIIIFQLNHKNMYEAITSQQEPCNICKQEQYSIKQCQKLHMNYTGFLYSNNWEQVQIDNLFSNFSQGINEFIEMDLKETIHQLEELEREEQIELLNDNDSQQNLCENGLKLSYSSLKAQISEILLTYEIHYDVFNVNIIREFSYFISSEFQQYDKEIAIEFLTWYFEIFMGKQDICQLIIFYNTNKQFMRDYFDLFRLFYQNCQKEDIYNYGKVNIEELEDQSFDQKILTKLQISQIVSEKQILQGLLEQILDQQVENLKNQLEIYQQYGFDKAINAQDFQENEKIFIEILEQCQSQNNNIFDDPLNCLIQDIIIELMYKEYFQNKSINEEDEDEDTELISQKQYKDNFFNYFELNNGNFKSMLQIFCNKKENQLFQNSLTMNFALAILKLFLKDIYQAIYVIFEGKQYDETFIKVFQAEYEELNNQKEQEQIYIYNKFIQYIIDMIDEDMNKFREQLNGDLPSVKNSNLRWLDKFIDNDTEDNYYPWTNCQQQKPDIKILPQFLNIPSSKKKLDLLINFIIDFALNQQLYTGSKYIQNQIENLNLPNETEQNQMLKRMLLSQLYNHQNQKGGNQQKIQQKFCLRKDQKSQLLVNNYTILQIFQVFLLSDTNDSYWKTLALSPEKIFNQNNYIPFMVNDPYIEKIKQTIDDNISTTRGRCKNCRGIVILNNCGNSVFQFQCFKCGIKMGGEHHQNKNYERIDKNSFQKYEIDNIKELNERGNFNQDLKDIPKDKMFRELSLVQFYFGNLMNYTCWIFQLYFSGKSEVQIYQILTDNNESLDTMIQNFDICVKQIQEDEITKQQIKEEISYMTYEDQIEFYHQLIKLLDFLVHIQYAQQQKLIAEIYHKYIKAIKLPQVFNNLTLEYMQLLLECLEEQQMDKLVKNCHAKFCEENKKVNKILIQAFEKNKNNVKIEELVNFKYQIGRFIIRMLCVIDRIQNSESKLFKEGLEVYYYDKELKPPIDLEIEIKYTKQFYDLINQKIDELKNIEKVRLKQNQPNQYVANINEIDQNMGGNNAIQPKQSFYATKNPVSKNKKKGLK
ncbi:hypothetical protein PPERSA_10201 [Pseudocohnilembus persalinus]|uniref:P-loop containing nucleoside triphosphate hydrolase n=1 Tax=Pseudocohnilembus persalinus TaxID=266149 RepID=A0A0V0QMC1_PSEPJ|nr:hypothetical protein PPERSA_10201 [Pseudocohnilembus persalinus]|eukprot:KRX03120.1 hypothetical protein PPERSA_10201 [Pseudocohnilembus persalinus]